MTVALYLLMPLIDQLVTSLYLLPTWDHINICFQEKSNEAFTPLKIQEVKRYDFECTEIENSCKYE